MGPAAGTTLGVLLVVACTIANAAPPATKHPSLVGRWRVTGCETSPRDPADCGRGTIVFTADRVTVEIGASDRVARPYKVVSSTAGRVALNVDGERSEVVLEANGDARWRPPGVGGRVGQLRFVREHD